MEQYQVTTDWLRARAADTPEAPALLVDGRWWRFGELDALADAAVRPAGRLTARAPATTWPSCCPTRCRWSWWSSPWPGWGR
ncbi:MAG: hypothetical protein IPH95_03625 [Candidatus Promineofilum sp.]|nr:hypothetical protein [Promineifilum sp.]